MPSQLFALETMRDRYWHNMAGRIQRAFRNYMRYKHECARRIQRFWKNNKEALAYAQIRDQGHQLLGGRKERRRMSLLSYRRFMGDYLDVNGKSPLGEDLANAAGIGCQYLLCRRVICLLMQPFPAESVVFSMRVEVLVSKLGRSSKPSPRFLLLVGRLCDAYHSMANSVQTAKAVYIVVNSAKEGMTLDRKVPLVTIKSVSMTNLRDDWMVSSAFLSGTPAQQCITGFERECLRRGRPSDQLLVQNGVYHPPNATHLWQRLYQYRSKVRTMRYRSAVLLNFCSISYAKKKEKMAEIKAVKDETIPRDDVYKSHAIHVKSGEPPNSQSFPAAKRKAGVVRPITQGKLLKAGGPSVRYHESTFWFVLTNLSRNLHPPLVPSPKLSRCPANLRWPLPQLRRRRSRSKHLPSRPR